MKINKERLLDNLNILKTFTDTPGEGVTRFSYGKQDAKARRYIIGRAEKAGAAINIDALQNIRMGLKTNEAGRKTLICGSHIDSVRNGGRLDGIYGTCAALEVLETLSESGFRGRFNYEAAVFAEEEGSNFGSTMTGSKFISGIYGFDDLDRLTDDSGKSLRQTLAGLADSMAYNTGAIDLTSEDVAAVKWDFDNIKAMLELHIEQGPVLDRCGLAIGIVDFIFGMRTVRIRLDGVGNHAGATPMAERADALCAAAECIQKAELIAASDSDGRTVATVGKIEILPNCSNVIPGSAEFTLEVRDRDEKKIDGFMDEITEAIKEIAARRGVNCSISEHSRSKPLRLDSELAEKIKKAADRNGLPCKYMDSGAVHDACMIARHVPAGMIFVPSIGGRSHVPEENTKDEDLAAGAQVLLDTIISE